ncbi:hypothetical protein OH799_00925 [Nocardia sp. NBC_00881]|uniref:hypothetical protein n=1 Tax=Nocardia sp. NBC_00881 TaxID=2975995 RepID=UPI00386F7B0A|nr:hypothetical protein OH799_00925 [Nocardia sp. NBC_00881]
MTTGIGSGNRRWPSAWELAFWDPARWQLRPVARRCGDWVNATLRRRRTMWLLIVTLALVVIPGPVGAVATAQTRSVTPGMSVIDGISWMEIRDSSGVPLADYMFATNHGSLLHPDNTAVSLVIGLEFAGYMAIVVTAIWVMSFALTFQWLDMFSRVLTGTADSLTRQVATPMVLTVAAAVGAFFVAWFVVRGYHAKAVMQVMTLVGVAVLGPIYLADPLADVLSSHGLLAQGRDVGVSIAAGLNGDSDPDPGNVVAGIQGSLADGFVRRPVQVWNFGHVVDDSPRCRAAWSATVQSGDDSQVVNAMKTCGDSSAYAKANHPGFGQITTGLLLLMFGTILLLFGAYLGIKIVWSALDSIYHAIMAIFGFAAGGFIYGPTQTFLVRNMVDSFVSAARMAAYTVFLGVYALFLGDLFEQARGQVMTVFVLAGIVMLIAIFQLRRLDSSLHRGNDWIANRFALALQGASRPAAGAAGGTALGMGTVGTNHTMSAAGLVTQLAALNTMNANPIIGVILGRRTPFDRHSRLRHRAELATWDTFANTNIYGRNGQMVNMYLDRDQIRAGASYAARRGGIGTTRGAAAAVHGVTDFGGTLLNAGAGLIATGWTDSDQVYEAVRLHSRVLRDAEDETLLSKPVGRLVTALRLADTEEHSPASYGTLETFAVKFREANGEHVIRGLTDAERARADAYLSNPSKLEIQAIRTLATDGVGNDLASGGRMMTYIGTEHARRSLEAVNLLMEAPNDYARFQAVQAEVNAAQYSDLWAAGVNRTPWNAPPPTTRP